MNKYKMKINTAWLERKRGGLLKELAGMGPFVDGSLVKVKRTSRLPHFPTDLDPINHKTPPY